jgi:hypothetical protein
MDATEYALCDPEIKAALRKINVDVGVEAFTDRLQQRSIDATVFVTPCPRTKPCIEVQIRDHSIEKIDGPYEVVNYFFVFSYTFFMCSGFCSTVSLFWR